MVLVTEVFFSPRDLTFTSLQPTGKHWKTQFLLLRGHPFSTSAKFFEKLTFLVFQFCERTKSMIPINNLKLNHF